jgi:DNA-directed RNA polymerase subunit RPC12/RpoP
MASQRGNADGAAGGGNVLPLVCLTCGRERGLERAEAPPGDLACEKCGGRVFRRFEDAEAPGEARADFRAQTERDLTTDAPAGEATAGDLHDLDP